jgi:hypothetical protein
MADLSTLMNIAPFAGSYATLQTNDSENALRASETARVQQLVKDLQQQHSFNDQANPLKLAGLDLHNQYEQNVHLPEGLQDVQSKTLKNQTTAATQSSTIDATNAGNQLKTAEDKSALARDMQGRLLRIGAEVQSTPAPLRYQALSTAFEKEGIDSSHPLAQNMIQKLKSYDPTAFGQYITQQADTFGKIASLQDTKYRGETESANTRAAAEKYSANVRAGAEKYAADQHLEGTKYLADQRLAGVKARSSASTDVMQGVLSGKVSPDKGAVAMMAQAQKALDEGDLEGAREKATQAKLFETMMYQRAAAGKAGSPTLSNGQLDTVPPPDSQADTFLNRLGGGNPAADARAPQRVRMIGPNGKPGSMSADQVQEALKHGYKLEQ